MDQPFSIIHLESPYNTLSSEEGQTYFSKILSCRLNSYQQRYGNKVFPFGSEDFISDILAIQRESDKKIVATFKYVSYNSCLDFSVEFPLFHTLNNPINDSFSKDIVLDFIKKISFHENPLAYMGSFTNTQDSSLSLPERRLIKDLITTAIVGIIIEKKVEHVLVTGIIPNGASNYIQWLGFEKFCEETVLVKDIKESPAHLLILNQLSSSSLALFDRYLSSWKNRQIISHQDEQIKEKDEAA